MQEQERGTVGASRQLPAWSVFVLALVIALGVGATIGRLVIRATEAAEAKLLVTRVRERAAVLSGLEPVVTSAESFAPSVAQSLRKQMQYIDFLMSETLDDLAALDPKFDRDGPVGKALAAYQDGSMKELELSSEGRYEEARSQNDALTKELEKLENVLAVTADDYREIAERTNRMALVGSLGSMALGAIAIGLLFLRFDRARRLAARQKRRYEIRFSSLVKNSADGILLVDGNGIVVYSSAAAERILGRGSETMVGRPWAEFLGSDHIETVSGMLEGLKAAPGNSHKGELNVGRAGGSGQWLEVEATNLLHDPNVEGIVCNFRDINDRKLLEQELTHQAFHDALTGLANRALCLDRMEHARLRARRHRNLFATLMVDLDDFKKVNDTLGHDCGDQLLRLAGERIRLCLRESDTAARLGGDEFAVLLEEVASVREAETVAERLVQKIAEPFVVGSTQVYVGASIGIAMSDGVEETAEEILGNADLAMYASKNNGKRAYKVFQPSMYQALRARLDLETELRAAIDGDELTLHYQPVVALETGRIVGAEALVRWNHPTRGLVPPLEFIPTAEETRLIIPMGRKVLEEACSRAREWQTGRPGHSGFKISVNVSPQQLEYPEFVDEVAEILTRTGLPPHTLILEITEHVLMSNSEVTSERLRALKDLGVELALDDFGTGYSSLSYLRRFPIDILKIDRAFVEGVAAGTDQGALADAVVRLGDSLGLKTVAEGIESADQSQGLLDLGCRLGQGFYFSKPITEERLTEALAGGRPVAVPTTVTG